VSRSTSPRRRPGTRSGAEAREPTGRAGRSGERGVRLPTGDRLRPCRRGTDGSSLPREALAEQNDRAGARSAYQQAIDSGHADAAPKAAVYLGVLLAEQGDPAGARPAYQQAIDSGHADAAPLAAVNLGNLLAAQGDPAGARSAYQRAIDSGRQEAKPAAEEALSALEP
jgi:predicted negative regulator of RcsB-dependent stress response